MNMGGRNISGITARMMFGSLTLILVMCALSAVSYASLRSVDSEVTRLAQNKTPVIDALDESGAALQAVLVAERTMLATSPGNQTFKKLTSDYRSGLTRSQGDMEAYSKLASTAAEHKLINQYLRERANWEPLSDRVVRLASSPAAADRAAARVLSLGPAAAAFNAITETHTQLRKTTLASMAEFHGGSATSVDRILLLLVGVTVLAIAITAFVTLIITRGITRPLAKAVEFAQSIAAGDLTQDLEVERNDEVGILAGALLLMAGRLRDMISLIGESARQVSGSSREISMSAQQLSMSAESQGAALEGTSASVEELTASIDEVAENAQNQATSVEETTTNMEQLEQSASEISKTLQHVSESSQRSVDKAQTGMLAVTRAVEAIKGISQSSDRIAGIVNVISDIADQTNLLALNASIEAARAGEHGRGFAVVADEVSKLAERSSTSTKEISSLIRESRRNVDLGVDISQAALHSMEEIIASAKAANEMMGALAAGIGQQELGFREIAGATRFISEMSQSISAATEEQTTNSTRVARAVENVNELTQQTASAAKEMSASTEELSSLAQKLQHRLDQFKVARGDLTGVGAARLSVSDTPGQTTNGRANAASNSIDALDAIVFENHHNGNGNHNGNGHRHAVLMEGLRQIQD